MTPPRTGRAYLDEVLEQPGAVLALAHRGGAYHPDIEGLENTLQAFRHAADLGYRYLETDVHATADGVLMAFHDDVLDRVSDQQGAIAGLTHADVRRARVGGREEIPTFAALVDEVPGARFNVDLKSDGAVRPLADFIAARDLWDDLLVGSFSLARLREFRRLTGGRVATSAAPVEVAAFLTGVRRRADFDALQVPHRRGRLVVTTARLVRRAHAAGKHVHVWTIDTAEEIGELLDRGVDGLFTDRTDVLKDVLAERGQWLEHR
ncbi:glycerophosphodiester phosphodiesterase family protein [Nocardioides sp.]|uniref:glycerophosphodiester phosphodiesterase family protein n=1 Tax=Nocardioides sp. TaxID=35761 RepID=UPI00271FC6F6|nr:glycerophosphodiester phosphodiesterase family protein [Nocardioides sp.]MDO9454550.1 glycerophosphodiester phosphodiesterase family protein [Nocardioides sp.]